MATAASNRIERKPNAQSIGTLRLLGGGVTPRTTGIATGSWSINWPRVQRIEQEARARAYTARVAGCAPGEDRADRSRDCRPALHHPPDCRVARQTDPQQ